MRRLHVVARHEQFLASGRYVQLADESATGRVEDWSIHEVNGAAFIRVDHDGRDENGESLLMEALREPGGQLERVDLHRYEAGQSQPLRFSADFYQGYVEMIGAGGNIQRYALPDQTAVWLGSWLLLGLVLDPAVQRLLTWTGEGFAEAAVRYLGREALVAAGREYAAHHYQIDETMTLWLDDSQVALRVETGPAVVRLSQYARRP